MVQLPVDLIGQDTEQWCWAATAQMIMRYHGVEVPQCEQAAHLHGVPDACAPQTPVAAIEPGWPQFERWGFASAARRDDTCLTLDEVKQQIDAKRPFAFSWRWKGGGGHMMAAIGYAQSNGDDFVVVHNPWPPRHGDTDAYSYASFVGGPAVRDQFQTHTHWRDYVDIVPDAARAPGGPVDPDDRTDAPGTNQPTPHELGAQPTHGTWLDAVEVGRSVLADLVDAGHPSCVVAGAEADAPGGPAEELPFDGGEPDEPLQVAYIFRDDLERWGPAGDLRNTITWAPELLVPIRSGGQVVSSILVRVGPEGWVVRKVGSPNFARTVAEARDRISAQTGRTPAEYFVVRVPHLYRVFLGREDIGTIELTPVDCGEPAPTSNDGPGITYEANLRFEDEPLDSDRVVAGLWEESLRWPSSLPETEDRG